MIFGNQFLEVNTNATFTELALEIFRLQSQYNPVYKQYLQLMKCNAGEVNSVAAIPFLPVEFFKSHEVVTSIPGELRNNQVFTSSGTSGQETSRHVADLDLY